MILPLKDNIPSRRFPFWTYAIIITCVLIFLYELILPDPDRDIFIYKNGFVASEFIRDPIGRLPTFITSIFIHGGWAHLIFNMLYLHIFGDNVEDVLGFFWFPVFFISAGIAGTIVESFFHLNSNVPMIGASGAISGVMGFYFILYPFSRINTLVFYLFFWDIVPIPAFIFLGFWVISQFFNSLLSLGTQFTNIAFLAHLGGFIFGAICAKFYLKKKYHFF
ncbi:MAG: rhomboid family intramembrane serine protease [Candidatus Hydrothermales bacterium]